MAEPKPAVRRHAALFIFVTVVLDSMGIGLIMPVMPDLLKELENIEQRSAQPVPEAVLHHTMGAMQ